MTLLGGQLLLGQTEQVKTMVSIGQMMVYMGSLKNAEKKNKKRKMTGSSGEFLTVLLVTGAST